METVIETFFVVVSITKEQILYKLNVLKEYLAKAEIL